MHEWSNNAFTFKSNFEPTSNWFQVLYAIFNYGIENADLTYLLHVLHHVFDKSIEKFLL